MIVQKNLLDNSNIEVVQKLGGFTVFEHIKDLSVSSANAINEYFASKMNVRKRQVLIDLNNNSYTLQAGAMQWMSGNVSMSSGVTGVGNFLGKMVSSVVTSESAVKPIYSGTGQVMLEPTYKHILLVDVSEWGSIVLEDGLFLACESTLSHNVIARSNLSSAFLGGEGLFNLTLTGNGIAALECPVPADELIKVKLDNDCIKIDGNMAIAWSSSLDFTVEKSTKSLLGSLASGEGIVNVYRGTGTILISPTMVEKNMGTKPSDSSSAKSESQAKVDGAGKVLGAAGTLLDIFS